MVALQNCAYVVRQELDNHAQYEGRPKDMQALEHEHQAIEEVVSKEGGVEGGWINPRSVYDPARDQRRTEASVTGLHTKDVYKKTNKGFVLSLVQCQPPGSGVFLCETEENQCPV